MDSLSRKAVDAALGVAREHGLRCDEPELLKDGANVLVHLHPVPVVARIANIQHLATPVRAQLATPIDTGDPGAACPAPFEGAW